MYSFHANLDTISVNETPLFVESKNARSNVHWCR